MTPAELQEFVLDKATSFGFRRKVDEASGGNAIFRSNLNDPLKADFFGFIRPEEPYSGAYSDFSLIVFPGRDSEEFLVSLCVGSQGFTNDYEQASLPGLRRQFLKLIDNDGKSFCKPSFNDYESRSIDLVSFVKDGHEVLKPAVEKYGNCLPVVRYLESSSGVDLKVLSAWLAQFANIRAWPTNQKQRDAVALAISEIPASFVEDDVKLIQRLISERRFIVLQGAPGTGKTFSANKIAESYSYVFFEQFHAETTYSDFVCGLEPDLDNPGSFKLKEGILYKALCKALELKREGAEDRVLLIIDEINRANLANVLGPIFYLFEDREEENKAQIKIGNLPSMSALPDNIDVVATMNTADRSLAVVDFALRRRFSWYTLRPRPLTLEVTSGKVFDSQLFNKIAEIFTIYASDEELNLQPGQSYFIFKSDNSDREDRIIYELMPLIKEYISEGYLTKARESFSNLFVNEVSKQLFE